MAASADDHLSDDELAAVALGDRVDRGAAAKLAAHLDGCGPCRRELAVLDRVIKVTRAAPALDGLGPDPDRLEQLWSRVAVATAAPLPDRIGLPDRPETAPARSVRRPARVPRALVAALVVVALGVGVLAGWLGSRGGSGPARSDGKPVGRAVLTARLGTPRSARGDAVMRTSRDGLTLTVTTTELPAWNGYYEVWLYDTATGRMVAVGTLGADGRGTFTMPARLDLHEYRVVDLSAQRFDGLAHHERSVLRGTVDS